MAFQKPKGSQIDIESVALDISNDPSSIGHIATGVTSDPGATATLDADYLRRDGTATMDGLLTMNGGAIVVDPANPSGLAISFDPLYNDGLAIPAPGQLDFFFGGSFIALTIDAAGNLPPGPEIKSSLPIRMNSVGPALDRNIINVNDLGVATINGNINVDVTDVGVTVEAYDPAIQTHLGNMAVHRTINDAGTSTTDLWSASKITTELALKSDTVHTHIAANISDFVSAVNTQIAAASINDLSDVAVAPTPVVGRVLGADGAGGWIDAAVDESHIANLGTLAALKTDPISTFTNDSNYLAAGANVSVLVNDANYLASGGNVSDLANDANYVSSGDNVSLLVNDAGYLAGITAEPVGDLSDVEITTVADGHVLVYDGVTDNRWENRLLVETDISDLGTTIALNTDPVSTFTNDANYTTDTTVATNHYTKTESDAVGPASGAKVDKVTGVSGNVVEFGASNAIADSGVSTSALAPLANPVFTGVPVLPSYTLGTLPTGVTGGLIYVSDANTSAGAIAFYNGSNWIDPSTGTTVA